MKILFTLFIILSFCHGQQLDLNFSSYTSGTTLEGQDSWTTNVLSGTEATISSSTPLSYSGYGSGGKYINITTTSTVLYFSKPLASSISFAATSTFYYSMLVNVQSADGAGPNCFFIDAGSWIGRIWLRDDNTGKWQIGVSKNNLSLVWGSTSFTYNQTYLIVVRYSFNPGATDDEAYVWVNPAMTGEPSTASAEAVSGNGQGEFTDLSSINGLTLFLKTGSPAWRIDDIRAGYGTTSSAAFADLNYDGAFPVELTGFTVQSISGGIRLNWSTQSEVNNYGFEIERRLVQEDHPHWTKIGFVEGHGMSHTRLQYEFFDKNVVNGTYAYRLKQIDRNGTSTYSDVVTLAAETVPTRFELIRNFPNPFNPNTRIEFTVPSNGRATLSVVNIVGQQIATLYDGIAKTGQVYHIDFYAAKHSAGIYFARLQHGEKVQMIKMVLVK
ncbi:MAG: T9SS type A sorting domain-containing protein [Bacteroidetes bacterium]|nr:T9SS type A sorting domain-containing protein [Bacteroidota bacterium]